MTAKLKARLQDPDAKPHTEYTEFLNDSLTAWIEATFGITSEEKTGRLIRVKPRTLRGPDGAAKELADLTNTNEETCAEQIQRQLLAGHSIKDPETGFPVFAFRLHQFLSRGDTVYASLESEPDRYVTLHPQQFVPGDRERVLLPLAFCRECGQEYYCVDWIRKGPALEGILEPRAIRDDSDEDKRLSGYLYLSTTTPWTEDSELIPEDWFEVRNGNLKLKSSQKKYLPVSVNITPDGKTGAGEIQAAFIPSPFRFCLCCGIAYTGRQRTDFTKLSTLGSEGRSTATTILSLSVVRNLRRDDALKPEARKLLNFTDNRQDAALQAGHFNDFVEIGCSARPFTGRRRRPGKTA